MSYPSGMESDVHDGGSGGPERWTARHYLAVAAEAAAQRAVSDLVATFEYLRADGRGGWSEDLSPLLDAVSQQARAAGWLPEYERRAPASVADAAARWLQQQDR